MCARRDAIRRRVELEEKRKAAEKLLESLKTKKHIMPSGFINETIRLFITWQRRQKLEEVFGVDKGK